MDTKEIEKANKPKKEVSRKVAKCNLCEESLGLYLCESGHGRTYCKPCLKATDRRFKNRTTFITHTECRACNFNPI